jgi:hypothetical protein
MKNPLLAITAFLVLAGVLFAQTSTGGAQSMVRALIWIVDTVSVEADIQGQVAPLVSSGADSGFLANWNWPVVGICYHPPKKFSPCAGSALKDPLPRIS